MYVSFRFLSHRFPTISGKKESLKHESLFVKLLITIMKNCTFTSHPSPQPPSITQNIYLGEQLKSPSSITLYFLLRLYFLTFRAQKQQMLKDPLLVSDKDNVTSCSEVCPKNFASYSKIDEGKIAVSYQTYLVQIATIQS